jgi:hypothetical protein
MKDTKNKFYSYTTNSTNFKNTSINVFANSNMFNEDITSNKYISSSNKQLNDTKRATIFNNQQLVFNNFKKELIPDLTLSKDLANNLTHTAYNINNRTRRLASFNNLNPIQLVKDTNKNILK